MKNYFDIPVSSWNETFAFRKGEFIGRLTAFKDVDLFVGYGTVDEIVKGEKFDIVFAHFGLKNSFRRELVFKNPDSRKQILKLRINRQAIFFGYAVYIKRKLVFYVQNVSVFEIPKAIDIKRGIYDYEQDILSIKDKKDYKNKFDEMSEFLESIKNK